MYSEVGRPVIDAQKTWKQYNTIQYKNKLQRAIRPRQVSVLSTYPRGGEKTWRRQYSSTVDPWCTCYCRPYYPALDLCMPRRSWWVLNRCRSDQSHRLSNLHNCGSCTLVTSILCQWGHEP